MKILILILSLISVISAQPTKTTIEDGTANSDALIWDGSKWINISKAAMQDTLQKTQKIYTPEMFGAVGNNSTDSHRSFKRLFTEADDSSVISFKPGITYKFTTDSVLYVNKTFFIEGNGAKFNFTDISTIADRPGIEATPFIIEKSNPGYTPAHIPVNYIKGDLYLRVDSSVYNNVERGDICLITTSITWGGDGTNWTGNNSSDQWEFVEILNTYNTDGTGDSVRIVNPLQDSYLSAGTVMKKWEVISGYIKNLTIYGTIDQIGNDRMIGLMIQNAKNYDVENVEIFGMEYSCLNFNAVYGGNISNFKASDYFESAGGTNYGLAIYDSQNITVGNSRVFGGRHAIDISGLNGISRNIKIDNCYVSSLQATTELLVTGCFALSTHPGCEFVTFSNNIVFGGTTIRNPNTKIINNEFNNTYTGVGSSPSEITIQASLGTGYLIIDNNNMLSPNTYSIYVILSNTSDIDLIRINDNYSLGSSLFQLAKTGTDVNIKELIIESNVANAGTSSEIMNIGYTVNTTRCTIDQLIIKNNELEATVGGSYAVILRGMIIDNFIFESNNIHASNAIWEIIGSGNTLRNSVIRNNFHKDVPYYTHIPFNMTDTNNSVIEFENNTIRDFTSYPTKHVADLTADSIYYGKNKYPGLINGYGLRITVGSLRKDYDNPYIAIDAQANDDYEVSISGINQLYQGLMVNFQANTANNGGATLEITEEGSINPILKLHNQALITGDIEQYQWVTTIYDTTGTDHWQMVSQLAQ